MFAMYGHTCMYCGHPGATDAGHLIAVALDPDQPLDPHAMRPAHGVRGCPTCGRKCNQEAGTKSVDSLFRPALDW